MSDLYKYLLNVEIYNTIKYIEAYEKVVSNSTDKEKENFSNEFFGRLDIIDYSISFFANKLGINAPSNKLRDLYLEYRSELEKDSTINVNDYFNNKLKDYYDTSISLNRPDSFRNSIPSTYRELYDLLEKHYNETYFEGESLKPMLQNDESKAFEYFSQYRYLSQVANNGRMKKMPRPAVNWLNGDIKSIDEEINSYNDRVDKLNSIIEEAQNNNTSLTGEQVKEQNELKKEKDKIIDECNNILEKFTDVSDYLKNANENLKEYEERLAQYKNMCKKLDLAQKLLMNLYDEYNNPDISNERKDALSLQIQAIFDDNRALFVEATSVRKDLKIQGDILFSDVTLNIVHAEKQVAYEFVSMFKNFDIASIGSVDLDQINDENLKKFIINFRQLSNREREIEVFLKNKKRLRNPNLLFAQSFAEEDKFEITAFNNYMNNYLEKKRHKKPKSPGPVGNTQPIRPIKQGDPIDLQALNDVLDFDGKVVDKEDKSITLDDIIRKVMGGDNITVKQNRKYMASKVKILQNPYNSKHRGNLYRVGETVSAILDTVMGIPIRLITRIYGATQSLDDIDIFKAIEDRAMDLTDEEVEVFLREFKNSKAISRKLPSIFGSAMLNRVSKYMQDKVAKINQDIFKLTLAIRGFAKIGDEYDKQANDENLPSLARVNARKHADEQFALARFALDKYIKLQDEGMELISGSGYEPLQATIQAHGTGLNSIGGRFSKVDYNPKFWDKASVRSHYEDASLSDRERVSKFLGHENLFIKNTKLERKAIDLFSNVSVGNVDYNPFVMSVDYSKDPLLGQLVTGVFMAISVANIVNNLQNVIAHNTAVKTQSAMDVNNQQTLDGMSSGYNSMVRQHNDMVSKLDSVRSQAESSTQAFIDAQKRFAQERIAATQNVREITNLGAHGWRGTGSDYYSVDSAIHANSANLTNQLQSNTSKILSDLQLGNITHREAVNQMQNVAAVAKNSLQNAMQNAKSLVVKQSGRFDYTAWTTAESLLSNGADLSIVSSELMKTMLDLPKYNMANMSQQLLLSTTTLTEQSLLKSALLNGGSLTAGKAAISLEQEKSENTTIDSEIYKMIGELVKNGHSLDDIRANIEQIKAEYDKEKHVK